jgi:hypothetical protein
VEVKNFGMAPIEAVHDKEMIELVKCKEELKERETTYDLVNDVYVSKESF